MNLSDFGWDASRQKEWKKLKLNDLSFPARVVRQDRRQYMLVTAEGDLSSFTRGRIIHAGQTPVIGDWVAAVREGNEGVIEDILPRRSTLTRRVGKRSPRPQIMAANIDTLFLVSGLDEELNLRRIERYLTLAWRTGAYPVVVLNKKDLCKNHASLKKEVGLIAGDAEVVTVSALSGMGLMPLKAYLTKGRTTACIGSSGVGKSMIINTLAGQERMAVRRTHAPTGEGRHTTSHRELIMLPGGGMIIDMPGMREIQLWGEESDLESSFSEMEELAQECRFRDCSHRSEPGCAVLEAMKKGDIDQKRYSSYIKQKMEFKTLAEDKERRRWKKPR